MAAMSRGMKTSIATSQIMSTGVISVGNTYPLAQGNIARNPRSLFETVEAFDLFFCILLSPPRSRIVNGRAGIVLYQFYHDMRANAKATSDSPKEHKKGHGSGI
jgi:hypothetical protein